LIKGAPASWFQFLYFYDVIESLPQMGTLDCIVEMTSVLRTDPQYLLKRFAPWTVQLEEDPAKCAKDHHRTGISKTHLLGGRIRLAILIEKSKEIPVNIQ